MLAYLRLQAVTDDAYERLELFSLAAVVVTPTETVETERNPDGDRLIEAALTAAADVIETGDQDQLT